MCPGEDSWWHLKHKIRGGGYLNSWWHLKHEIFRVRITQTHCGTWNIRSGVAVTPIHGDTWNTGSKVGVTQTQCDTWNTRSGLGITQNHGGTWNMRSRVGVTQTQGGTPNMRLEPQTCSRFLSQRCIFGKNSLAKGSDAAKRSPGRQMRLMNPPGDPRSCHRWSVWRLMDSLGFTENVKVDRVFHRCTDIKCPLCLSKMRTLFGPFWLVAWSQQIIDWWTTQKWDGPPNH